MNTKLRRALTLFALIAAGESIFGLPFIVPRLFRPTLLEVFEISNLQLGTAFSVYGVVAMLAYFPGGTLADRFSARGMMVIALLTTALGGLVYQHIPSLTVLTYLFGFWGLTTILLFWAAIIRATRNWGGPTGQERAFGLLDGGRGLLSALLASSTLMLFSSYLPEVGPLHISDKRVALCEVIKVFTGLTFLVAALVWMCVPSEEQSTEDVEATPQRKAISLNEIMIILKNPAVWLQGMIIITAYTGYKGMDDLSLFAKDVYGMNDVEAGGVSSVAFWVRPFAAILAGMIGGVFGGVRAMIGCFSLICLGNGVIALGLMNPNAPWMIMMYIFCSGAAIFGLRGLYFSIFDRAGVPPALMGTAIGFVSVIGYTPDIFIGPINGYLTDTYPGALGHEYFFGVLCVFAALGLLSAVAFNRITQTQQ